MNDNWRKSSKCGADPELWYPISETSAVGIAQVAEAKRICRSCPVISECRADVLAREGGRNVTSRHGIAAALTPGERYGIARRRARRTTAAAA